MEYRVNSFDIDGNSVLLRDSVLEKEVNKLKSGKMGTFSPVYPLEIKKGKLEIDLSNFINKATFNSGTSSLSDKISALDTKTKINFTTLINILNIIFGNKINPENMSYKDLPDLSEYQKTINIINNTATSNITEARNKINSLKKEKDEEVATIHALIKQLEEKFDINVLDLVHRLDMLDKEVFEQKEAHTDDDGTFNSRLDELDEKISKIHEALKNISPKNFEDIIGIQV
jgi:hypothetical protein